MIDWIRHAFQFLFNVQGLVQWGGTVLVCVIVFVETGLFLGFFLPGDSLLVTAGVFAAGGHLRLSWLLTLVALCAIAGDQLGYFIGWRAGEALYRRRDSFFFKKKHLDQAHAFYEKHGGKTVVLARFVPIIRTFAPPVAGAARMRYRRFFSYDVFGGIFWVWSMVLLGFTLGSAVPDIDRHIHIVIAVVVLLSISPGLVGLWRSHRASGKNPAAAEMRSRKSENV
jgi:membrane-associated protein